MNESYNAALSNSPARSTSDVWQQKTGLCDWLAGVEKEGGIHRTSLISSASLKCSWSSPDSPRTETGIFRIRDEWHDPVHVQNSHTKLFADFYAYNTALLSSHNCFNYPVVQLHLICTKIALQSSSSSSREQTILHITCKNWRRGHLFSQEEETRHRLAQEPGSAEPPSHWAKPQPGILERQDSVTAFPESTLFKLTIWNILGGRREGERERKKERGGCTFSI